MAFFRRGMSGLSVWIVSGPLGDGYWTILGMALEAMIAPFNDK